MQLLNHNQRPWKTFSCGFAITIFISFLFECISAEYDCSAKEDGWYYDPEFCHIYWRCIHGSSEEFECASGTAWDHHENRCNWLDSVDCSRAEKTTAQAMDIDYNESGLTDENSQNSGDGDDDEPPIVVVKKKKKKKKKDGKVEAGSKKIRDNPDDHEDLTTTRKKSDTESSASESNAASATAKEQNGNSPSIECQPTGIYSIPDPVECSSYYQCDKGTQTKLTCPERKLFDTEKRECNEFERVNCGSRAISSADKNQCVSKRDGIYPDIERDCHFYYQCLTQKKLREAKCPGDQKYSNQTGRCGPANSAPFPCSSWVPGNKGTKISWNSGNFIQIFLTMVFIVKLVFQ